MTKGAKEAPSVIKSLQWIELKLEQWLETQLFKSPKALEHILFFILICIYFKSLAKCYRIVFSHLGTSVHSSKELA